METLNQIMSPEAYVRFYYPFAQKSERVTGISGIFDLAQGADESAWGNKMTGDYNIFGIKADANWTGAVKFKTTHEFVNGNWIVINAPFRSYPNADAAFTDHAQF